MDGSRDPDRVMARSIRRWNARGVAPIPTCRSPVSWISLLEVLKDAYKKRVMNKMKIQEAQMNALLQKAPGDSPLAILRRLKEMEQGEA